MEKKKQAKSENLMNKEIKISWFLHQSRHSTVLTGTETPSYPRGEGEVHDGY